MKKLLIFLLLLFSFLGQAWGQEASLAVSGSNYIAALDGASVTVAPIAGQAPKIQSSKWQGAYYLNIQLQGLVPPNAITKPSFNATSKVAQWTDSKGNVHRHYVAPDPNGISANGVLEHSITLPAVPASNILTFNVTCSPQIEWLYQPLTPPTGLIPISPAVNGSYALYIDKAHRFLDAQGVEIVNYQTGKYCHIYALTLTDAKGNVTYAPLTYTPTGSGTGTLVSTMDATFLANAVYPVVIDPTIGYASLGAYESPFTSICWANCGASMQYTANAGDTITQYFVGGLSGNASQYAVGMSVYNTVALVPLNRQFSATVFNMGGQGSTPAWYSSSTISQALTGGTTYDIAAGGGTSGPACFFAFDVGAPSNSGDQASSSTLPAVWVESANYADRFSFYATVTAGSTGWTHEINNITPTSVNNIPVANIKTINNQ